MNKTDVEHSATWGPAQLRPHRAEVPQATDWTLHAAAALEPQIAEALTGAWLRQFCADVGTPETAARCLACLRAPDAPWATLASYFGEDQHRLRATLRGP